MPGSSSQAHDLTEILHRWQGGDDNALEELFAVVYPELRQQAIGRMRGERSDHTLQPTALIHEAYLRLVKWKNKPNDRIHFFAVASKVMRQVLVDYARTQGRQKRGSDWQRCTLRDAIDRCAGTPELVIDLDEMLERLSGEQERTARILELHYFGGMNYREISVALAVSERTVSRELRFGKAWLRSQLGAAE